MSYVGKSLEELRRLEYDQRLIVNRLQREASEQVDPLAAGPLFAELVAAQQELFAIEEARRQQEEATPKGVTTTIGGGRVVRGGQAVGATIQRHVRMQHVPTAIYHLLDPATHPLVTIQVNTQRISYRLRVTSYIEEFSAQAVDTVETTPDTSSVTIDQLPTLFPGRIRDLTELTRATLHVKVEDLNADKTLDDRTLPLWLLARTSAPLAVKDEMTGAWADLSRYLGAFVTPNEPSVMRFQRDVAERHSEGRLVGYQGNVESQARAIFEALKLTKKVAYVNSIIDFNPDEGAKSQRVRLPRESLDGQIGNCIDATLLFASLLEGISINPAIVVVPKHAFVGWQTDPEKDRWQYLETTMIQTHEFPDALKVGSERAALYAAKREQTGEEAWFRRWSLRDLRTKYGITPME